MGTGRTLTVHRGIQHKSTLRSTEYLPEGYKEIRTKLLIHGYLTTQADEVCNIVIDEIEDLLRYETKLETIIKQYKMEVIHRLLQPLIQHMTDLYNQHIEARVTGNYTDMGQYDKQLSVLKTTITQGIQQLKYQNLFESN